MQHTENAEMSNGIALSLIFPILPDPNAGLF